MTIPSAAPKTTSLNQCSPSHTRLHPTKLATKYAGAPTFQP